MSEIRELENMVLYFQNRILRKQIQLAEQMESFTMRFEGKSASLEPEPKTSEVDKATIWPPPNRITLGDMWKSIRDEFNGCPFSPCEIKHHMIAKFPEHKNKIALGYSTMIHRMVKAGRFQRVENRKIIQTRT